MVWYNFPRCVPIFDKTHIIHLFLGDERPTWYVEKTYCWLLNCCFRKWKTIFPMVTWPFLGSPPFGSSPKAHCGSKAAFCTRRRGFPWRPPFCTGRSKVQERWFYHPAFLQLISEVSGKRPFYRWKIRCGEVSTRRSCGAATESEHSDTDNVSWHLRCAEKVACSGQAV